MSALPPPLQRLTRLLAEQWHESSQPVFCDDVSLSRIYSNPAFERLVGIPAEAMLGVRPPYSYWAPDSWEQFLRVRDGLLDRRLQQLGVRSIRGRFRSAAGRVFDVLLVGGEICDGNEAPVAILTFVVDLEAQAQEGASTLPTIESSFVRELRVVEQLARSAPREDVDPSANAWESLTQRERQVAEALGAGARVPTIARELGISAHTVRNHLKSIFRKTGLRSQEEIARRAPK